MLIAVAVPMVNYIGVARGCSGCTCTPRAEKKIGVIYSENL